MISVAEMALRWLALESSPEVLTNYIHELGVEDQWGLVDVFGLDDEMLAMVPKPVGALLLVFPVKATASSSGDTNPNVFFMKQTIENACGTVGLLHALGNSKATYKEDSALDKFMKTAKGKSPEEIARLLETNEDICDIHASHAREGQTSTPSLEEDVDLHFVAIVLVDGHIYELDGRKNSPTKHGASDETSFLKDAAAVCKAYMDRMPDALNFSLTALVKQ